MIILPDEGGHEKWENGETWNKKVFESLCIYINVTVVSSTSLAFKVDILLNYGNGKEGLYKKDAHENKELKDLGNNRTCVPLLITFCQAKYSC